MNRRAFLAGAVALPYAPTNRLTVPIRTLTEGLLINGDVSAQMILQAHISEDSAETYRRSWIGRAFLGMGEWYLDSSESRELPSRLENLPGSLHYHRITVGVAAEKRSMLVGAFRHDYIACILRTYGNTEEEMLALAEFFASRPVPEQWELLWNDAQLQTFVPKVDTFSLPVEPDDSTWF